MVFAGSCHNARVTIKLGDSCPRRTRSDIVRLILDHDQEDDQMPSARVQHLLGALDTGVPDLAEEHRRYVLKSLRKSL